MPLFFLLVLTAPGRVDAGEPEPLLSIEKNGFGASLGMLMNVWFVPYAGEDCWYGDPVFRPGIDIHRTTLMFMGKAPYGIDFGADLTLGLVHEHEADFEAVRIGWEVAPALKIIGGYSHHAPFTSVAMTDHHNLLFTERPLGIEFMMPRGQPGLTLESRLDEYFFATAGLFKQSEWERNFLFAGRIVVTPLKSLPGPRWGFGQDEVAFDEFRFGIGASVMSYKGDIGQIWGLAVEAEAFWKILSLAAEFVFFRHETGTGPESENLYDTKTAYGQAAVFVWKDRLLIAARYQWYDGNLVAGEKIKRHRITGGLHAFFMNRRIRLSLEYIHQYDELPRVIMGEETAGSDNEILLLETRIFL